MKKRFYKHKVIEVRVPHSRDPEYGHMTLEWLGSINKKPDTHYEIDMHGGQKGYTSFWFKDRLLAIRTKLLWG